MTYDFSIVLGYWQALLQGLGLTLKLTLLCAAAGSALGFFVSLARVSSIKPLRWISTLYVEFFRGTPVLIQLFWFFFCLPIAIGTDISNFVAATLSLTLYTGAITSETFRASLKSIRKEEIDACIALGLSRISQVLYVILPQAILRAIPTLLSNFVSLFKESALVSAVGMADLMFVGQNISSNIARPVEVLTMVALIYFVVAFPLTRAVTVVERKMLAKLAI
ncbi:amino acid ABC transporter permease [Vogesella sp. LYT5W]|uniref:Amino acid ABC transporter permease n=1 Tax=Vogesella margarita TaxID=2984199 RepID=A0ABT5IM81_9NEIS|nr:amino acid ABC transporter permease [Vogesella margarita]MDC7713650.1 amino acid ABC transporter permease [Vogesella margarita]